MDPDLATLLTSATLSRLARADAEVVAAELDQLALPAGATVFREGDADAALYVVLDGRVHRERRGLELPEVGPGGQLGELGFLGAERRQETATAVGAVRLARLTHARYLQLAARAPHTALRFVEALLGGVAGALAAMTDVVGGLLGQRSLPRHDQVTITIGGAPRTTATGTRAGELLPTEVDGELVVAALLDERPVSLATPLVADAWLAPLTLASVDGREVFRRSAGLAVLEAAARVLPDVAVRLGPALDSAQRLELDLRGEPATDVARRLDRALAQLVEERAPLREESWTVEEARAELAARGWTDAVALLETWREPTVALVSCGGIYALRGQPPVLDTGVLAGIAIGVIDGGGLVLTFGPRGVRRLARAPSAVDELEVEARAPRWGGEMVEEQRPWRAALGITSVGEFNRTCVSGGVDEIIRVAEGFHEKRVGRLADAIAARRDQVRVIAIAGPSSSGKSTLIRRLTTQLEVVGLRTSALSLDDYYVDRERTPRDERGEYDYECLDALDLPRLRADLRALLAGATVRLPRYDFKLGQSLPAAGAELQLEPGEVLLLEGIHGLDPRLLGDAATAAQQFRVFIHPASGLPIDRLSRVSPYELRLLRRIVRDRHTRNISAADNIVRWPSVRRGETVHVYPFLAAADVIFDSSLVYEPSVLKVYAERYLLEVPRRHPAIATAHRLRQLVDRFVAIYPDHVPPTSILREFIGGSAFEA